jgi:hypothetical protein
MDKQISERPADAAAPTASRMLGRSRFITGVCGITGRKLLENVVARAPTRAIGIDNNESELFYLQDEYRHSHFVKLYTAGLRDRREVDSRIAGCEFVLHTAAVQRVFLCAESAFAAIHANVRPTENIVDAAVKRVLATASGEAVSPKRPAEPLVNATKLAPSAISSRDVMTEFRLVAVDQRCIWLSIRDADPSRQQRRKGSTPSKIAAPTVA